MTPDPVRSIVEVQQNIARDDVVAVVGRKIELPLRDDRVEARFPKRITDYYSVTDAEIEVYAQFGWLSTIFFALFGASIGFVGGCITALLQDNIPATSEITLRWLSIVMGVVSFIFFATAIVLTLLQRRNKRTWKVSE